MTAPRLAAVACLVLLFSLLTSAIGVYDSRQGALTLEGNSLYSSSAVTLSATPADARSRLAERHESGRVFIDVADGGRVRLLTTIGTPSRPFPLHSGRQPTADDDEVALVGSAVPVLSRSVGSVYLDDGREYPVIGRLGLEADSLVADQVLLLDRQRSDAQAAVPMVVDSDGARRLFLDEMRRGTAMAVDPSTNRRTNVDFVSPILIVFGTSLALFGFAVTGALAGAGYRARAGVARLAGATRPRALLGGAVRLSLVLAPFVALGACTQVVATGDAVGPDLAAVLGAQIVLAVAGFTAAADRSHPLGNR
ncbi:hypothetical protein AS850_11385 [Frondihabitans sp. 762G35]|uniref:hypothetical protein n=1 Tax=Frondihabitans sp. 762G35 TaxID=1446794 RepID=UPI000D21B40A|nr:hypothetical protein [Frondihabitans sp. 762G35]ARC57674.1 hypothetical protein AS850_11385 [Frondihabitans sp. 762G35]